MIIMCDVCLLSLISLQICSNFFEIKQTAMNMWSYCERTMNFLKIILRNINNSNVYSFKNLHKLYKKMFAFTVTLQL